jgi:hypothetical protein
MHPRDTPGIDNAFGHQLNRRLAEAEVRHTLALRFKRLYDLNLEAMLVVGDVCNRPHWQALTLEAEALDIMDPIDVLERFDAADDAE